MEISHEAITSAKKTHRYSNPSDIVHEHDDCIRIAYQWLDAQETILNPHRLLGPDTKHLIERWAGRYISRDDVEIAASMHPKIRGAYPHFNLSRVLTRPSDKRLEETKIAFSQGYRKHIDESVYKRSE